MRFAFHYRAPFLRQLALCEAFEQSGTRADVSVRRVEGLDRVQPDCDGLILFGIGGASRDVFEAYRLAGKHVIFLDKGYVARNAAFRVAVNCFQPVQWVKHARCTSDRWISLGVKLQPYRVQHDGYVLFDGASNKYCIFQRLGQWDEWGRETRAKLQAHSKREVRYRPRPSHNIRETLAPLVDDMAGAAVVVSYGGNLGFEAVVQGVPHFALGDSVARPMSETRLDRLDVPYIPNELERAQWAANIAHCQYSIGEISSGLIWSHVLRQL